MLTQDEIKYLANINLTIVEDDDVHFCPTWNCEDCPMYFKDTSAILLHYNITSPENEGVCYSIIKWAKSQTSSTISTIIQNHKNICNELQKGKSK